ncbi:hypothetical protein [Glacieibacterium frigidum]|uniref:Uncharacterized protein n=1 Tax=Glacieibacterium frigidum TaxID=2593303 RepID=A0A552UFN5_9SPHN|nr:hypothetical protein [Glacieibacterium frigidum]TRW17035.1 hypothetical protein FMM06_02165 [Glacieibacterium frigidum]
MSRTFNRNVVDFEKARADKRLTDAVLNSDGGGGTYDGMERRVTHLETSLEFIKRDVGELRVDVSGLKVDLARLDERVKNLPGKGFIVSASITIIGLITAMIVLSDQIKTALGLAAS